MDVLANFGWYAKACLTIGAVIGLITAYIVYC